MRKKDKSKKFSIWRAIGKLFIGILILGGILFGGLILLFIRAVFIESPMPWDYDAGSTKRSRQVREGQALMEQYLDDTFGGGEITMIRNDFYTSDTKYLMTDFVSGYFHPASDPETKCLFQVNTVTGEVYHDYYEPLFIEVFQEKYLKALPDCEAYTLAEQGVHPYAFVPCTQSVSSGAYDKPIFVNITDKVNESNVETYLEKYLQGEAYGIVRIKGDYSGTDALTNCSLMKAMKPYSGAELTLKKYDENDLVVEELEQADGGISTYKSYKYLNVNENIFIKYQTNHIYYDKVILDNPEFRVEETGDGFKVSTDSNVHYCICFNDKTALPNAELYCDNAGGAFGAMTMESNEKLEYTEKEGSGKYLAGSHTFLYE